MYAFPSPWRPSNRCNRLAEYIESEPERKAAKAEAQKAKLEALERKLGIDPKSGSGSNTPGSSDPPVLAGKKHRFEDNEYLEQSKELVEGVKSAVSAGTPIQLLLYPMVLTTCTALLKKKKKQKLTHDKEGANDSKTAKVVKQKSAVVAEPPPPPTATIDAIGA